MSVGRLLAEHPETIGNFIWPYQCAAWDAKTRFARISGHLDVLEELPGLKVADDEKIRLGLCVTNPGTREPTVTASFHATLNTMAPGLPDLDSVRAVCAAVDKPFNFMVGIKGKSFTVAALAAAGVKRISLATSLYRAAMTGLLSAAKEVREHGTFGYIDTSLATPDMNAFLRG